MSGKNNKQCPRTSGCKSRCPPGPCGTNRRGCSAVVKDSCGRPIKNAPPPCCHNPIVNICNNNVPPPCCSNVGGASGVGGGGNKPDSNKAKVEEEVNRLVEAAKQFSEKEKLKLKEYYEQELERRKQFVIQELKCAMEKDVIAPLKEKLCACEKELEELKEKYAKALKAGKGSDLSVPSRLSKEEMDVLERELKKAHKQKDVLEQIITEENLRKSKRLLIDSEALLSNEFMEHDLTSNASTGMLTNMSRGTSANSVHKTRSGGTVVVKKDVQEEEIQSIGAGTASKMGSEGKPSSSGAGQDRKQSTKSEGTTAQNRKQSTKSVGEGPSTTDRKQSTKSTVLDRRQSRRSTVLDRKQSIKSAVVITRKSQPLIPDDPLKEKMENDELSEEVVQLKEKIKNLTVALNEAQKFAEEEIEELIKEQHLREELERELAGLLVENADLKARVEDWLEEVDVLDNGKWDAENSKLRKRILDLEGDRTRAEVEAELKKMRDELKGVVSEARRNSGADDDNNMDQHGRQCSSYDCAQFTEAYATRIKELEERIEELEDQLKTMTQLEQRIKELEADSQELEALKERWGDAQKELDQLRGIQCPIDEEGLNALRMKLKETEKYLQVARDEINLLEGKAGELEDQNALLSKSVAEFEKEHERTVQLEAMHAQMLEEKRRKSEDARQLAERLENLEKEYETAQRDLDAANQNLRETTASLQDAQQENDRLRKNVEEMKDTIEKYKQMERDLNDELRKKEKEIRDLESKYDAAHEENERLKRELDDLRERYDTIKKKKDSLEKEVAQANDIIQRNQQDFERKLKEQARKAQEKCSELSAKGRCILDHEKKTLEITTQLAQDNHGMQERIRQLEDQLEQMMSMENRTRGMFKDLGELQKRAQARTQELEELKKLPETCKIDSRPSDVTLSPVQSLPALPVPSDQKFNEDLQPSPSVRSISLKKPSLKNISQPSVREPSERKKSESSAKLRRKEECTILQRKMEDLEEERRKLEEGMRAKMKALEDVQKQLEDVSNEEQDVKGEFNASCND